MVTIGSNLAYLLCRFLAAVVRRAGCGGTGLGGKAFIGGKWKVGGWVSGGWRGGGLLEVPFGWD